MVFFGGKYSNGTVSLRADYYDDLTGIWSWGSMTRAREMSRSMVFKGKYYVSFGKVAGGATLLNDLEIFDPVTQSWSTSTYRTPVPRAQHQIASAGDLLVIAGGRSSDTSLSNWVDYFNSTSNQWYGAAELPLARMWGRGIGVGTRAYFAGGSTRISSKSTATPVARVDMYDSVTGIWSTPLSLSKARFLMGVTSIPDSGLAFFAGGHAGSAGAQSTIDVLDTTRLSWIPYNYTLAVPRQVSFSITLTVTNNGCYFIGGENSDDTTSYWNTVDICTTSPPPPTTTLPVPSVIITTTISVLPPMTVNVICMGTVPIVGATCNNNKATWVVSGTVSLDGPLLVESSTPLLIQGDLNQHGNNISIVTTTTTTMNTSQSSSVLVNGTIRLGGILVLNVQDDIFLLMNDTAVFVIIPVLQADSIIGSFDDILVVVTNRDGTTSKRSACATQQSDGHTLSVLLRSSACTTTNSNPNGTGLPLLAVILPIVFMVVIISSALLVWYLFRVRRVWNGADRFWRSQDKDIAMTTTTTTTASTTSKNDNHSKTEYLRM